MRDAADPDIPHPEICTEVRKRNGDVVEGILIRTCATGFDLHEDGDQVVAMSKEVMREKSKNERRGGEWC